MNKTQNVKNVTNYKNRTKQRLIEICGGKCNSCGYDNCNKALEFHHINEDEKEFGISVGHIVAFETSVNEVKKCVMVCANCHREIHDGILDVNSFDIIFNKQLAEHYIELVNANRTKRKEYDKCFCGESKLVTKTYCSSKCCNDDRRNVPKKMKGTDGQVLALFEQLKNYEAVGRALGVTGAAVKRRIKKLGV